MTRDELIASAMDVNGSSEDSFAHYGVARRSGRYPWGSGDDPYQRTGNFHSRVAELKKQGFTFTDKDGITYKGDSAIWRAFGMESHQEFRACMSMSKDDAKIIEIARIKELYDEYDHNVSRVAKELGMNESSIRSKLKPQVEANAKLAQSIADHIKKEIDESGKLVDVGDGTDALLNVSREKLNEALAILESQDYHIYGAKQPQVNNPGKFTNLRVVGPPDTPYKINALGQRVTSEIYKFGDIHYMDSKISHDDGETFDPKWVYPASMNSKRLKIRYAEEGGLQKDGLVEIRPGVEDLSLGKSNYAQVRILVDGTHYIKGMAVYNPDLPDGVDVVFNTNKKKGVPAIAPKGEKCVLKEIKSEKESPGNPFGSLIKPGIVDPKKDDSFEGGQSYYYDKNGNKHLSLINKRGEEGDWGDWADKLSAQFLSKQNVPLIKRQTKKTVMEAEAELADIMNLDNPVLKKTLLNDFADSMDTKAVHLDAKALPGQKYQVILPLTTIGDKEIYAPNYKDGEQVCLVRYPHAGTFEIPMLTVNNGNKEGKKIMTSKPIDAVGISAYTAEQLSGADFDGDTVMVLPVSDRYNISHRKPIKELQEFDAKREYPERPGMKYMTKGMVQRQMGEISNLITDMSLAGAPDSEMVRAVKHSMVVIDAYKHKLDYKLSEQVNDIKTLKKNYQGVVDPVTGKLHTPAGTLISRSRSKKVIDKRRGSPKIDPETGDLIWKESGEMRWDYKTKKMVKATQNSTKMAETKNAYDLVSDISNPREVAYAEYANALKGLARKARLDILTVHSNRRNPQASKIYDKEVKELEAELNLAKRNSPRERQAQGLTTSYINAICDANPELRDDSHKKELRKLRQQQLTANRAKVGAHRHAISVTDRQWEAIQAGAISPSMFGEILKYADKDKIREYATPRNSKTVSQAKISRMQAMANKGQSAAQIAEELGISPSTVHKYIS